MAFPPSNNLYLLPPMLLELGMSINYYYNVNINKIVMVNGLYVGCILLTRLCTDESNECTHTWKITLVSKTHQ